LYVRLIFSVVLLGLVYVYRLSVIEWSWVYSVLTVYGVVVTPFLIFSIVVAYCYRPVPDRGYRPKVSVIVPCFNDELAIVNTIDSILKSDYPKDKLELVVVDDCSVDGSLAAMSGCSTANLRVVALPWNVGKRHAVAAGLKRCTGDVVVLMDSDTVVDANSIVNLVQPFRDEKVYCVCGNAVVHNSSSKKINSWLAKFQRVWYADAFRIRKGAESLFGVVLCCSGALAAYRRDKMLQVADKWINEKFAGRAVSCGDDRQLTNAMLELGGKSVFQSNALAYTIAPHGFKKFMKQQERWGRGSLYGFIYGSKFFPKKNWKQKLIFYSTMLVSFLAPVALALSFVSIVLIGGWAAAVLFFAGHLMIGCLVALNDKLLVDYFTPWDMLYRVVFFVLMSAVTFVYLYAWLTPWKGTKWGTR